MIHTAATTGTTAATDSAPVPVAEVGQHIIEGLQVDVIFPDSTYLQDVKAELRKVFKQWYLRRYLFDYLLIYSIIAFSNPCSYEELMGYFSRSGIKSPNPSPAPPLPPAPAVFGHTFMDPM